MATSIVGRLVYLITGDSKMLNNSLASTQAAVAKFSKFVLSALGIGGAMIAFRTLIGVGKDLVAQYAAQEKAENALAASIRATGGDVDDLMEQYRQFASEIQRTTTIGDEQVLGLLQQARSFGVAENRMREATRGAIGLSKAFGIDMNTALRGIALAMQGQYITLNRYIPALRTATTEAEKQAALQKAMAAGFEIATAEAQTSTGSMDQFKNALGDLKEEGGRVIIEFLAPSIRSLTDFVAKTTAAIAESQRMARTAKELAAGKKVTAAEELKILNERLRLVKAELENEIYLSKLHLGGKDIERFENEIRGLETQIAALNEIASLEMRVADAKRKGDAEAAADAEKEIERQKALAEWIKAVNDEHAKTPEGQRAILEAQIAKWEYELSRAKVYKPIIQDILNMLYKQRDANLEIASSDAAMAERWVQMGVTMGAVRDQELAYQAEVVAATAAEVEAKKRLWDSEAEARRIVEQALYEAGEERRRKEKAAEEQLAADKKLVQQQALDSFVAIWGELRSLNDQKAQYELNMLKRKQKAELAAFEGTEEEKRALEEQFERQRALIEYEGALRSWRLQITGGLAAAARAIIESMKLGWPWNLISVAMTTILTGIQMAAIYAAKPVPEFTGGGEFDVPAGYPHDSFPMFAETGEHVTIEPAGARPSREAEMLHATFLLDGRQIADFVTQATRSRKILIHQRAVI